jgi:hypothetical protein
MALAIGAMMSRRQRHIAIHEAAHAVAALCFRFNFHYVTIIPTDDAVGQVKFTKRNRALWSDRRLENYLIVTLAGPAASMKQHPHSHPLGYALADYDEARHLIFDLKKYAPDTYLRLMEGRAKHFVESHWPQIEAVAAGLIEHGTLKPDDVQAAMLLGAP